MMTPDQGKTAGDAGTDQNQCGKADSGKDAFSLVPDEKIVFHKNREDDFDYQISDQDDFDW